MKSLHGGKILGVWLLLAGLAGMVASQLYTAILLLSYYIINSEVLRLPGWSTQTLTPIGRVTVLLLGILWLGFVAGLEWQLRRWEDDGVLLDRVARLAAGLSVVYVALDALFLLA